MWDSQAFNGNKENVISTVAMKKLHQLGDDRGNDNSSHMLLVIPAWGLH